MEFNECKDFATCPKHANECWRWCDNWQPREDLPQSSENYTPKPQMPHHVIISQRQRGFVLEFIMLASRGAGNSQIWPPALIAPHKPRIFATRDEARQFAIDYKSKHPEWK